jgi:hypothetical protein
VSALAVTEAASALGVRPGTLMRWVREGAPVVQRGRRGRGCALLVDPAAVRRWRGADARDALVLELAQVVPEILAAATEEALRSTEGPHKRALAGCMAAGWYLGSSAVLDHLRAIVATVPEVTAPLPEPIERLRKIAASD